MPETLQPQAPGTTDAPKGAGSGTAMAGGAGGFYVEDISPFVVAPEITLRAAVAQIERGGEGLALVLDPDGRLLGTVTDGDVRRTLLAGVGLEARVGELLLGVPGRAHPDPITAPLGTSAVVLLRLMGTQVIRHVPLLDPDGRVAAVALLSRMVRDRDLPLKAVIMAGGLGTRLRPLTEATPKPMLPVGDRPLLEHTIEQLGQAGIRRICITTHYRADKIKGHFGDGSSFGAAVDYVHESQPLGTAGALRQLEIEGDEPLLVINGDVLTTVNYRAMLDYHREHGARLTMGVRRYAMKVPYGVVEGEGPLVSAVREKPEVSFFVNAGLYLIEPAACRDIPADRHFDMTEFIERLIAGGEPVVSFPIHEYWLDIGQLDDYARAQQDLCGGRLGS